MADGSINEISLSLGRLAGDVAGIRELIEAHNVEADRHWDRIESELRTVKHDQRGMEQNIYGLGEGQRRAGERAGVADAKIEEIETQLGRIRKTLDRADGMFAVIVLLGSALGAIILHYGTDIFRWFFPKI